MAAPCLALVDVVERLASPVFAVASPLTGTPVLAVDATTTVPASPHALAAAAARIAVLPCPSVALASAARAPETAALLAAFDVVVATRAELETVVAAIERTPLAAATLVHVLRAGAGLAADAALVLESLGYATLQGGPEFAAWLHTRPLAARHTPAAVSVVRVARTGEQLTITLDRPARHNAFSAAMRDELLDALALAAAEPALAVVLCGAGPSFCSGGDLDEFGTAPDPATAHLVRTTRSPARVLAGIGARVEARVHGACIGAGIELAAFAGRVVATPDAFFQLPEVGMGLIPGAGGTTSLPVRIGRQRTAYLALTGRRLDAATAHAWGLVDAIRDVP